MKTLDAPPGLRTSGLQTVSARPRVVQFAVPYSPNVGDGIISDCLCHALSVLRPDVEFRRIDLSGRRDFGEVTLRHRALIVRTLSQLPRPLRHRLVTAKLSRMLDRLEPEWRAAVDGADLAILGGGQLFSDADLNFCLKIARASKVLAEADVPVVVHAVGVARNWSRSGTELFAKLFDTDLQMIGLRDPQSLDAWIAQTDGHAKAAPPPEFTRDPGLLAAACYGAIPPSDRIGIGVTAAEILSYHADETPGAGNRPQFFVDLAAALADRGQDVALFCNGAIEDRELLARLAEHPELRRRNVTTLSAPETPTELAQLVGGLRGLIAHRLHACIVGYAYGIPVVGLGWDRKVESFFASTGRSEHFLPAAEISVEAVVERAEHALQAGIDPAIHREVVDETWAGVRRVVEAGLRAQRTASESVST
ncbi:polysaccharide pyruvyl transferase family protein [Mangrovicoccus sp. HB161399]|uniref:polysaccharide pyruvyl transferase family protein n=1 Tax=Mangrovicoccus sp. HB161399 TaxID=2720392 RepID=UPI0015557ED9|nr:polysaccharide pyruvyl transferase family protein [Mangrovicoccus sp. HB161399]